MPAGMTLKRVATVFLLLATAALAGGCASADHSWRGEFDARLEGASLAMEETLAEAGPNATKAEEFRSYTNLGRELRYKGELIEGLDPPRGCADVQIKGLDHVKSSGLGASMVH